MSIRLNAYIAGCGICSRREADRLIGLGEVTVNGVLAHPGDKVDENGKDLVAVRGREVRPLSKKKTVAYYKPAGVTCTASDPHAKVTLSDAFHYPVRLSYAGRLDRDSEGLLLMTNDGALIEAMMRGSNGHEKEYIVRTEHRMSDVDLARMCAGIFLKELGVKTRPAKVERLGDKTFSIVLTEGLNREIRRMVKTCGGNEVRRLKRVRVLNIALGDMKPGQIRELSEDELGELYREAGLSGRSRR